MPNEATNTTTKPTAATRGAQDAPTPATKIARTSKGAPKGKKGARKPGTTKAGKPAEKKDAKHASKGSVPREFSKKAIVLDLMRRKGGATMAEIAKATGWQKHSIRGFISGTLSKKMGLAVESTKNEAGERVYRTK
jgi:hypothetical protein